MRGYSPRQSRKVAEALASEYQEDRTQYLTGLLNSYGRDGLVTNEYGNSAIGGLADEGSPLANFYATIYPNAKDQYNTETGLAKDLIQHGYDLEKLGIAQGYTQDNMRLGNELGNKTMNLQHELNQKGADAQLVREKVKKLWDSDINLKEYAAKTGIDLGNWKEQQDYLQELKKKQPDEVDAIITEGIKIGQINGLEGEQLTDFTVRYLNAEINRRRFDDKKGKAKTDDDTSGKKGNAAQEVNAIVNALKVTNDEIESLTGYGEPLDEDSQARLDQLIKERERYKEEISRRISDGENRALANTKIPAFSDNEEQNIQTIRAMRQISDWDDEELNNFIDNWIPSDRTPHYKQSLRKKALGY